MGRVVFAGGQVAGADSLAERGKEKLTKREQIGSYVTELRFPDTLPLVGVSMLILAAAVSASLLPAARAARVDAIQALRSE